MGRNVEARAQARRAQDAFEQRTSGALAVRAGDVDEARGVLRPVQGVEQRANTLQAEFDGLEFVAEGIEEPDGFGIRGAQDCS